MIEIQPNPYTGGKRLVVVGTLGNPETVTQAHFDALGKDARSSHLERFIADGLDLNIDLRDVTMLDGTIANSDMSTAQTSYVYSRRTVFPGTTMPKGTSSLNHDFTRAILRAKAAEVTGSSKDLLEWTASFIDPDSSDAARLSRDAYINSWAPAIKDMEETQGYSEKDVEEFLKLAFGPFPKLASRLTSLMAMTTLDGSPYQFPFPVWDAKIRTQLKNPNDRLEASLLLDGDLDIVAPRHYVLQWTPKPYLRTIPSPRPWGWWETSKL